MKRSSLLQPFLIPLALFIASFALYFSTLAPGMLRGDSGEFQWAMASLNVPHATGYPLFTLLGFAWLHLPLVGPAAGRLNLLSAIFGAAAVTTVYICARSIVRRPAAALAGALFLALAPVFWFNASILEVYTLNAFFLALILYLVWRWSRAGSDAPLYLASLVFGLALAHHRMIVLALPGLLAFILLSDRRFFLNWRRLSALALLLLPGLALYIYVPLRLLPTGATLDYAVNQIILGKEYSGSLFRQLDLWQVLVQIPVENFHVGLALAAVGLLALFRRAGPGAVPASRPLAIMLVLVYLADVAFALAYWVPDVQVFLTPSFVVLALWIAAGAAWTVDWLAARLRPAFASRAAFAAAVVLAAVPLAGLAQYATVWAQVQAEAGSEEARAREILAANLPPGALLELDWETATAVRFLQTTEHLRPDLEARLIKVNEREEYFWALQNVDAGRAVYVESGVKWTRAVAGYQVRPAPIDLALISRAVVQAESVGAKIDDRVTLAALRSDRQGLVLYWQVHRPLQRDLATFVHYFDASGQPLGQEDHAPCCEAIYGYRTSEWETGRTIADSFRPVPAGTTYLQIGMYALTDGDLEGYGRTLYLQVQPVILDPAAQSGAPVVLGSTVVVRGYSLSRQDGNWKLIIFWQSKASADKDYQVFVHLLDASGKILQQADRQPLGGVYPTSTWQPGQLVQDTYLLPAAEGGVALEFGLYEAANGRRLPRADGNGDKVTVDLR